MNIGAISAVGYTRPPMPLSSLGGSGELATAGSGSCSAPFLSPVYKYDPVAHLNVLTIRDATTGTVTNQYPSQKIVEQYRRNHGAPPVTGKSAATATVTPAAKAASAQTTTAATGTTSSAATGVAATAGLATTVTQAPTGGQSGGSGSSTGVASVGTLAVATASPTPRLSVSV